MADLSDAEIASQYFDIDARDLTALALLGALLTRPERDKFIDDLYERLLSWPDTGSLFPAESLSRAKESQRQYFNELFSGVLDSAYLARRRAIGATHDRLGVRPYWYLAAYAFYLSGLLDLTIPRIQALQTEQRTAVAKALIKIILFDAALAWEEYTTRREGKLEEQRKLIVAQQEMVLERLRAIEEKFLEPLQDIDREYHRALGSTGQQRLERLERCCQRGDQLYRELMGTLGGNH